MEFRTLSKNIAGNLTGVLEEDLNVIDKQVDQLLGVIGGPLL